MTGNSQMNNAAFHGKQLISELNCLCILLVVHKCNNNDVKLKKNQKGRKYRSSFVKDG